MAAAVNSIQSSIADDTNLIISVQRSVMHIYLNRPQVKNALDTRTITELIALCKTLRTRDDIRVIVLSGIGDAFCAGADLQEWTNQAREENYHQNENGSIKIAELFDQLSSMPQVIVGRINGAAIGGGAGLVAICDIAVGVKGGKLGFPEINIGLAPAVISPYVVEKIGLRHARELFLTGSLFNSIKAENIGLLNHVVENVTLLDAKVAEIINKIISSSPNAIAEVKLLLKQLSYSTSKFEQQHMIDLITKLRVSDEGREGMNAFLERRKTEWNRVKYDEGGFR